MSKKQIETGNRRCFYGAVVAPYMVKFDGATSPTMMLAEEMQASRPLVKKRKPLDLAPLMKEFERCDRSMCFALYQELEKLRAEWEKRGKK